ncbi:hypothetical protein VQ042_10215 [Aurantimonas sp. A2-1-M11]|uniref:hypothetical protein n=1 Tax=Aurantimonas sp. A2-1-M11 TaxID=3113712 RepID=UPI002F9553CE
MMTRLTALTVLIAGIGAVLSLLAHDAGDRPGSAFGTVSGGDCNYRTGIVCTLVRDPLVVEDTTSGF